jgi:hypothetical protein
MVIFLIMVLACSGCSVTYLNTYRDLPVVTSLEEAWAIADAIEGVEETEGEHWQEPRETYYLQTGDCEDIAALFVALIHNSHLGEAHIAVIEGFETGYAHAVVAYKSRLLEAQKVGMYYPDDTLIITTFTLFEYIMYKSVEGGY